MPVSDIDRFLSFAAFTMTRRERIRMIANSLNVSFLSGDVLQVLPPPPPSSRPRVLLRVPVGAYTPLLVLQETAFSSLDKSSKRELLFMSRLEFIQLCVGAPASSKAAVLLEASSSCLPRTPGVRDCIGRPAAYTAFGP